MGNSLCNDKKDDMLNQEEIKIVRFQTVDKGGNNIEMPSRAKSMSKRGEVTEEEKNMKVKALQGSWNNKKTRDLRKGLAENVDELGQMLNQNALIEIKSSQVLEIQSSKPLQYEEDLEKYNLHKNLVTLNPVRLPDGSIYYGQWSKKKVPEGIGEMIKTHKEADQIVFEGLWKDGEIIKGRSYTNNGAYFEGEMKNWMKEGEGTIFYPDGSNVKGKFEKDKLINGKFLWNDNSLYNGQFNDLMLEGVGTFISPRGELYEGHWKGNQIEGEGCYIWTGADDYSPSHRYVGNYRRGKKEGAGTYYFKYPEVFYQGHWLHDRPHGEGNYHVNGKIYFGLWRFGKLVQVYSRSLSQTLSEKFLQKDSKNNDEIILKKQDEEMKNDGFVNGDFNFEFKKENINSHVKNLPYLRSNDDQKSSSPSHSYKPSNVHVFNIELVKFGEETQKNNNYSQSYNFEIKNTLQNSDHNFNQMINIVDQVFPSVISHNNFTMKNSTNLQREYDQKINLEEKCK